MSLPTLRDSRKFHRIDELGLRGSKKTWKSIVRKSRKGNSR